MKVSDLVKELNLTVFCGEAGLDAEISGGYTSDLLSDVMGHIDEGMLWVTMQTHQNIVAVATLKDAAAVLIVPLVALAVPITDTLLAIVRRKSSGVPIFSPDKNHLHHRLLAKGLNQKQVVLIMYALTAFFSCIALVVIHLSLWAGIAIVAAALILFILWARKLGVMKEIVPSPYQMKMKKEKEEKGKESKSKGPEEKPALK